MLDHEGKSPNGALWGCKAISKEIGKNERQTFYLLESGLLPAQKVGRQWVTTRSRVRAWLHGEPYTNKSRFAAN